MDRNYTRKFPSAKSRSKSPAVAVLEKGNFVDEVGEKYMVDVKRRRAEVILPTRIGIGNIAEVPGAAILGPSIICMRVGVSHLVLQVAL